MEERHYNKELCEHSHAEIDKRLDKGEEKMKLHDLILLGDGNGNKGVVHRVYTVEQCLVELERQRQESNNLFWRIMTPCIPTVILALAVGGWYLMHRFIGS